MQSKPFLPNPHDGTRGIALIVTLTLLVLLTVMVVSFVSVVTQDRGATQSYTQSQRAQEIALGGLDQIVSQIRAEITDPANNSATNGTGTNAIYVPNATNAAPQRMVAASLAPILTLSSTNAYGTAPSFAAVGNCTTNPSINNRQISLARWNKPQFLPAASLSSFPAPNWIIVTRSGPKALAAGATPSGSGLTVGGFTSTNAAVGRYAYVVYNTSGLLDINVAGFPNSASASATTKGLLPWADISKLTNTFTANDADTLVKWRNAANAANYANYVTNGWSTNGFMRVAPGDTAFLSRQELIKYAQTHNTDLTAALPYLTTFSREVNGPTWGPSTNLGGSYNYLANATNTGTLNPTMYTWKVVAGGWTRQNGTIAVTGEPLVKYRFPLDKLALLEKLNGSGGAGLTATDKTDIQKYFGLDLAADANGPTYRHWTYPTTSRTGNSATGILTLDQVASLGSREPDFFELLQAGILSGSLAGAGHLASPQGHGRADMVRTVAQFPTWLTDVDPRVTYHVLRIGANIIDQWDADSFPTTITGFGESYYGIEDLPYINKFMVAVISTSGTTIPTHTIPAPPLSFYAYFQMWNPHQQSAADTAATGRYPSNFQIAPLHSGGSMIDQYHLGISVNFFNWYYDPVGGTNSTVSTLDAAGSFGRSFGALTGGGVVPFTATPTSYRAPAVIPAAAAAWAGGPNILALNLGNINSFPPDGAWDKTGTGFKWVGDPATGTDTQASATYVAFGYWAVFRLQYKDAGGNWRTYGTFEGLDDSSIASGFDPLDTMMPRVANGTADADAWVKCDPRTSRFGPADSVPYVLRTDLDGSAANTLNPSAGTLYSPVCGYEIPFLGMIGNNVVATDPYRMDMWSVNNTSVTPSGPYFNGPSPNGTLNESGITATDYRLNYYADPDLTVRYGDDALAYPTSSPYFTTGALATVNPARPIVLNRPFSSVGDLGYVFRDQPWKTLDLFSANSADAGLLDLFTMSDAPVVAGRINPNTAPAPVLQALLSGAHANDSGGNAILSDASAASIATALVAMQTNAPFATRAGLVTAFATNSAITSYATIKTEREAVVRALAESSNTRTWNFLIDIIAQSGIYPTSASTLNNFNVTGERRYWLHIAIDRYTGQIVDKQLEIVTE